jgi:hypothetical protein
MRGQLGNGNYLLLEEQLSAIGYTFGDNGQPGDEPEPYSGYS